MTTLHPVEFPEGALFHRVDQKKTAPRETCFAFHRTGKAGCSQNTAPRRFRALTSIQRGDLCSASWMKRGKKNKQFKPSVNPERVTDRWHLAPSSTYLLPPREGRRVTTYVGSCTSSFGDPL